jgi:hypothetical protein
MEAAFREADPAARLSGMLLGAMLGFVAVAIVVGSLAWLGWRSARERGTFP